MNIVHIYAENVKDFPDYDDLIEGLSDPDHYSDIDMLILSPTWSTGINIVNEFDLIVGDYVSNQGMPLHPREIFQALHRERNPKHIVIQLRLGFPPDTNSTLPPWPTKTNFAEIEKWKEALERWNNPEEKKKMIEEFEKGEKKED